MAGKNGGKRPGAGRPKNATRIIATAKSADIVQAWIDSGEKTPLEVMLMIMKNAVAKKKWSIAMNAANSAAPYVHPKLQQTTLKGDADNPVAVKIINNVPRDDG